MCVSQLRGKSHEMNRLKYQSITKLLYKTIIYTKFLLYLLHSEFIIRRGAKVQDISQG